MTPRLALATIALACVGPAFAADPTLVAPKLGGGVPNGVREDLVASDDLRWIAFTSTATNLDAGDTDAVPDVYLTDTTTGVSTRISRDVLTGASSTVGCKARAISGDGRSVAMYCSLKGLIPGIHPSTDPWGLYVYERDGDGDGVFDEPGDLSFIRLQWDSAGAPPNPTPDRMSFSDDGRKLAFRETFTLPNEAACGASRVWLVDRDADADGIYDEAGSITASCPIPPNAYDALISGDGNVIAFATFDALVPADVNDGFPRDDVYAKDLTTGVLTLVSLSTAGASGTDTAWLMDLSRDGSRILFDSQANNMFPEWTQHIRTSYIRDLVTHSTEPLGYDIETLGGRKWWWASTGVDLTPDGTRALVEVEQHSGGTHFLHHVVDVGARAIPQRYRYGSEVAGLAADGDSAVFLSSDATLVASDFNAAADLFLTVAAPDVHVTVSVANSTPIHYPGGRVIFQINYVNEGNSTSAATVMRVPTLTSGTVVLSSFGCVRTNTTVECPVRKLHPGEGYTERVDVAVAGAGSQSLTGMVQAPGDVDPSDDSATASATVIPGADLDLFMTAAPSFILQQGATTIGIVQVENLGTVFDATNVRLSVDFDPDIGLDPTTLTTTPGGSCTLTGPHFDCLFPTLAPGATAFMRLTLTGTVIGNHSIQATVSSDVADPSAGNNSELILFAVLAPPPPPPPDDGGDGGDGGGGGGGGPLDPLLALAALMLATMRRRIGDTTDPA